MTSFFSPNEFHCKNLSLLDEAYPPLPPAGLEQVQDNAKEHRRAQEACDGLGAVQQPRLGERIVLRDQHGEEDRPEEADQQRAARRLRDTSCQQGARCGIAALRRHDPRGSPALQGPVCRVCRAWSAESAKPAESAAGRRLWGMSGAWVGARGLDLRGCAAWRMP